MFFQDKKTVVEKRQLEEFAAGRIVAAALLDDDFVRLVEQAPFAPAHVAIHGLEVFVAIVEKVQDRFLETGIVPDFEPRLATGLYVELHFAEVFAPLAHGGQHLVEEVVQRFLLRQLQGE